MKKIPLSLAVFALFSLFIGSVNAAESPAIKIPKPTKEEMKYVQDYAIQREAQTKMFLALDEKMFPQARVMAEQKKHAEAAQKQNWLQNVVNPANWFKKPDAQPAPAAVPVPQPIAPAQPTPVAAPQAAPQENAPSFIVLPPKEDAPANKQATGAKQPEPKDEGPAPVFGFTR